MRVDKSVASLNTFAFDFYRLLSIDSTDNVFFSPFSVLTTLNMALLGAKNNTEKELFEGLGYSLGFKNSKEVHAFFKKTIDSWSNTEAEFTLYIANRVLVHKAIAEAVNEDYLNQLQAIYNAQVDEVNFKTKSKAAVKTCNEWVNNETKGKITSILDSLPKLTVLVLVNAIYFKGVWEKRFNKYNTKKLPFFNFGEEEKAKDVPLMSLNHVRANLYSTSIDGEELRMLELPYKGDISMNILLPKSLNGLKKIEASLKFEIIDKMKLVRRVVDKLWLPKFKMETTCKLVDTLKSMGLKDAFSNKADFGGIRKKLRNIDHIKISKVIHQAVIEVNEEGTVAAARTRMKMTATSCSMKEMIEFRVDHPFAYFIKDVKSGVILFAGSIYEL